MAKVHVDVSKSATKWKTFSKLLNFCTNRQCSAAQKKKKKLIVHLKHSLVNGKRWIIKLIVHPLQSVLIHGISYSIWHIAVIQLHCPYWLLTTFLLGEAQVQRQVERGKQGMLYLLICIFDVVCFWHTFDSCCFVYDGVVMRAPPLSHFSLSKAEEDRSQGHRFLIFIWMA